MAPIISYSSRLGLALETAWGTAATAPTAWIPFKTLKTEDDIKQILDSGIRGSFAKDYNNFNGVMSSKGDFAGMFYPDVHGYILKMIFGQDTVTGASAPYTHKFTMLNNAQPPSATLFDYDGINERVYAGSVLEEVGFKFTTEGELEVSTKFAGKASVIGGSIHTPTYGTVTPFLGFQAGLQIAGAGNTRLIGGDVNIKRPVKMTFGANSSQNPTKANVGVLEMTGKLDFEIEDYTELNYYLNNTQPAVVLTFTNGTNILTIQMTKCDFEKVAGIDRSQEMIRVSATIRGLYNTTDSGPGLVQLVCATPTYN